uniref:histidine kinase n=1 Tax=Picochlorum atomus TaxID=133490 RepID=A0A126WYM9_PICAT|nr:putative LOV domain-containing protein [Picochlorum atomus]|eukprot:jgi/Picsp_1/1315/NSC_04796-R1_multi-sensor hybrid histidine kinase
MEDEVELKPMDGCQGDSTEERLRLTQEVSKLKERVRCLESELEFMINKNINNNRTHETPEYVSQERDLRSRRSVAEGREEFKLAELVLHQRPKSKGVKQTDAEEEMVCIPRATLELLYLKEKAMDAVKEGITIADARLPDMPLIYINEGFSRMTGYPTSFVMNKNCRFLQGESTDPNEVAKLRKAVKSGEACTVQIANYKRSGDPFMNYLSLTPIHDAKGNLTHYVGIQSDITDLVNHKQAELSARHQAAEAAAATEAKSQFLARMSHEIRTPLNGMIAVGQLLAETRLTPQQWDLVNTIRCSGEALLTLVTDILDFSKIEANKMELSKSPFFLESTVEAAVEIAGMHAAQKRLHLSYYIDDNVPGWLIGDAHRLQQILLNILNNAVKFTDSGEILMEIWSQEQGKDIDQIDSTTDSKNLMFEIHFRVRDTGIGIAAADLARLFHSFSQLDATPTRKVGGSGLGLTISQKLCEAMGGKIKASSEGNDQGSTFEWYIVAPKLAGPPPATLQNPLNRSSESIEQGKKVLLVERSDIVRNIMYLSLRKWGCQVHAVASGFEAMKALKLRKPQESSIKPCCPCSVIKQQECHTLHAFEPRILHKISNDRTQEVEGPFDVIIMDMSCSELLYQLMNRRHPDEARRVIFLGWPGETTIKYSRDIMTLGRRSSDLLEAGTIQNEPRSVMKKHNSEPTVEAFNGISLAETKNSPLKTEEGYYENREQFSESQSEDIHDLPQLGYVVVSRPVRQGRLRLGLTEVLELDLTSLSSETTDSRQLTFSRRSSDLNLVEQEVCQQGEVRSDGSDTWKTHSVASSSSLLQAPPRKNYSSNSLKDSNAENSNAEKKLLLAEDNMINMKVALGILKSIGFTNVQVAYNGLEAISLVEDAGGLSSFHAILMDLHMPKMGGIDAVKQLRKMYPEEDTKIIAVTADAFEDTRDQCVANGFTGWLAKPFRIEEFAKVMSD